MEEGLMAIKVLNAVTTTAESGLEDLSGPNENISVQFSFDIGSVTAMKIALDTSLVESIPGSEAYEHPVTADEIAAGHGKFTVYDILGNFAGVRITSMTGAGPVDVWIDALRRY
jgi:hypothetical protein